MASTYTTNTKLAKPAVGDTGWGTTLNGDFNTLDALNPLGGLAVTTHEVPSASLNVDVAAGNYVKQDGTIGSYAGSTGNAITSSTTKVLYLDGTSSYALTIAASYPSTAHVRLGTVVAGSSTITSVTDNRQSFPVCGNIADGIAWTIGSTNGLQIGTVSTQKFAVLGATPAAQQTGGSATASGSYTSTEQGMLQKAYNALLDKYFL